MIVMRHVKGFKHYDEMTLSRVREAAEFAQEILKIPQDHIIYIGLCDGPVEEGEFGKVLGTHVSERKGLSRIYVNRELTWLYFHETLFHEIVHAKQHAYRELVVYEHLPGRYWKGKAYAMPKERRGYLKSPWEVEACDMASTITALWVRHKIKKKAQSIIKSLPLVRKFV